MIKILDGEEDSPKNPKEEKAYNEGFVDGYDSGTKFVLNMIEDFTEGALLQNKWTEIKDEIPEKGRRLLYFFEGTGVWSGFYYGRDEQYPSDNDHVFGSEVGFLTGDVTHWSYIPDYPKGSEWRVEGDREFAEEVEKEIYNYKESMGEDE